MDSSESESSESESSESERSESTSVPLLLKSDAIVDQRMNLETKQYW